MVCSHDAAAVHERVTRSCELLASSYRRRVIYALRKNGPVTVSELADAVVSAGVADARDRALTSLIHTHLPKLADHGVVEYDGPDEPVSLADGVESLEPFLAVAAHEEAAVDIEQLSLSSPSAPEVATSTGTRPD